jgi:hypothetical protein
MCKKENTTQQKKRREEEFCPYTTRRDNSKKHAVKPLSVPTVNYTNVSSTVFSRKGQTSASNNVRRNFTT